MKNFAMPCACYTSLNGATGLPKFLTISGFALAPLKYQRLNEVDPLCRQHLSTDNYNLQCQS